MLLPPFLKISAILKSMRKKKIEERIEHIISLLKPYKPKKIILFGSTAKGKNKKNSDIDLLIIKDTTLPFWKRQKEIVKFLKTDIDIDAIVLTPKEVEKALKQTQPFIYDIIKEGKVIYEA